MAKSPRQQKPKKSSVRNSRSTVSGPARPDRPVRGDVLAEKAAGTQDLAAKVRFNPIKSAEYDPSAAVAPPEGKSHQARRSDRGSQHR